MKKYVSVFLVLLIILLCVSCGKKEHKIMDSRMSWGYYSNYNEALDAADLVVVGEVKNIGKTHRYDIELHPYEGKVTIRPVYYTPVEIVIKEIIKGEYTESTVIYQALGGEIDNVIYDYTATDTLSIRKNSEILVFLRITKPDLGYESISPGCAIIEDENGKAMQSLKGAETTDSIEDMVYDIKLAKSKMNEVTE
ncbi:MAG: hypothetical protein J6M16_01225 [Clostridia bacterium]|nr:hypothetical protein [Clostridia bacterium]